MTDELTNGFRKLVSARAQSLMPSDFTRFFSSFFREHETQQEGFDLSIGNVCNIPVVQEVLHDALVHVSKNVNRITKYPGTQGYYPLNQKIVELIKKETGVTYDPEEIVLTNGACDSLYGVFYTFSNPGDYSCYCIPSFPYWSIASKAGVQSSLIIYKNPFDYSKTYGDIVAQKISANRKIRTVIINEPHNPIAKNLDKSQLYALRDACEEHHVFPVLDEVYRSFSDHWIGDVFDPNSTVMVDSFSKRFGMPGLRLGFVRMQKRYVPYFRASLANQVVGISMVTSLAADYILEHEKEYALAATISREIRERQRKLDSQLRKLDDGVISHVPEGGIYRLLDISGLDITPSDAAALLMKQGVKAVSGDKLLIHGIDQMRSPNILRLSVGGEPRTKEAGQIIVETFEKLPRIETLKNTY